MVQSFLGVIIIFFLAKSEAFFWSQKRPLQTIESARFFDFWWFGEHLGQTCTPTGDSRDVGTCLTTAACTAQEGKPRGSCASGFGVCCVLEMNCGSTVRFNQSYLVNKGFPNSVSDIANCQYIIEKVAKADICQIRLEYETLILQGPSNTSECGSDTFSVLGTVGEPPIVVCGKLSGQHMYFDLADGRASLRINIATTTSGQDRSWKIKVDQIACDSSYKAPPNCLQYFPGYSGTINSFNYQDNEDVHQLAGQRYTICIKAADGFCGVTYKSDDFSLTGDSSIGGVPTGPLSGDISCTQDFISVFVMLKDFTLATDRYCGTKLEDLTTYMKPFQIRVYSDLDEPTGDVKNRGFSISYSQIPC